MTITEIINALRCCARQPCCDNCPRYENGLDPEECTKKLMLDCAEVIKKEIEIIVEQGNRVAQLEDDLEVTYKQIVMLLSECKRHGISLLDTNDKLKMLHYEDSIRTAADKQKTESENTKSSLEYDYCGTPKRRYDIEAQLPKEGEWMTNIRWDYQQPTQSTTKNVGTHFLCTSTGKLCPNATEYGYCKQTVCNSCDCMEQKYER